MWSKETRWVLSGTPSSQAFCPHPLQRCHLAECGSQQISLSHRPSHEIWQLFSALTDVSLEGKAQLFRWSMSLIFPPGLLFYGSALSPTHGPQFYCNSHAQRRSDRPRKGLFRECCFRPHTGSWGSLAAFSLCFDQVSQYSEMGLFTGRLDLTSSLR